MICRMLERLGLFVGVSKEENNEALFFVGLNSWILSQCGGRWDTPRALDHIWRSPELVSWIEKHLSTVLNSPRAIEFLGVRRYLGGGLNSLNVPWGWKDPRTTVTLPIWLHLFPEARVLWIERHGVDVANSLRTRSRREFSAASEAYQRHYERIGRFVFLKRQEHGFTDSPRCLSIEEGFQLWKEYCDEAAKTLRTLPKQRVLMLQYEQILADPLVHLRASAEFAGLTPTQSELEAAISQVKLDRAFSFRSDPELTRFAQQHQQELLDRGFGEPDSVVFKAP